MAPRILALLLATLAAAALPAHELRVATWNLEWRVSPATAHAARRACDNGGRSPLPCDVARRLSRDSADHARMAAYVRALDADVVAVQEVESAAVLEHLFRGYRTCLAPGPGVQHAGFAIRAGLPHRCEPSVTSLSLEGRTRPGALLTLWPGTAGATTLLSLHLKSGCSSDPPGSTRTACQMLVAQMQRLSAWLSSQVEPRLIVLGDFNRAGVDAADPLWRALLDHPSSPLQDAGAGVPFRNCHDGQPFWQPIDHILLSPALAAKMRRGSFHKHGYRNADALAYRLSDHCPVSIDLQLP